MLLQPVSAKKQNQKTEILEAQTKEKIIRKETATLLLEVAEKTLGTDYVSKMYPNFYRANKR